MSVHAAGWQITGWYVLVLIPLFIGMKLLYLRLYPSRDRRQLYSFLLAPSLAGSSWQKRRRVERGDWLKLSLKCVLLSFLFWLIVSVKQGLPAELSPWLQGYAAIVPFWLMLELLESLLQLVWLPSGRLVPALNNRVLLSASVADFWGRRWNRMFGDWLYGVCFRPFARTPLGLSAAFAASALIHELLVSVPYLIVYEKSLFGLMSGYFVIQLAGILAERKFSFRSIMVGRVYCWVVVLGPAPLVLNQGTLRIFHLAGS